jgi:4'-phosphopantetheinyl transferase
MLVAAVPTPSPGKGILAVLLRLEREGEVFPASLAFSFSQSEPSAPHSFLHPDEELRWREMKFPLRKKSYLLGRRAAKAALGACFPSVSPRDIHVANGVYSQPYVRSGPVCCELSLAHSQDTGVALVLPAGYPGGVDLELIDSGRSEVAASCLTATERPLLDSLGLPAPTANFLLWSVKEAIGKTLRCGLAVPFDTLAISSVEEHAGRFECLFAHFPPFKGFSWVLGDYMLTIVLPLKSSLDFSPTPELVTLMRSPQASSG